jgi:hypothetical protein
MEFLENPTDSGIPEIQSNSRIPDRNYISPSPSSILTWLEFNPFDRYIIPVRNSEALLIPELRIFSPIPEFLIGITSRPHPHPY